MTYIQLLTWLRNNGWHQVRFSGNTIQHFRRLGNKERITLTPKHAGVVQDPKNPHSPVSCVPIADCSILNNALHINPATFQPQE